MDFQAVALSDVKMGDGGEIRPHALQTHGNTTGSRYYCYMDQLCRYDVELWIIVLIDSTKNYHLTTTLGFYLRE